jgi:molybdate transport system ATP-binding protein
VGPSGSGKSTVLRCIAGLHAPRAGRITCGGEVWLDTARGTHVPTGRRRVGMVFQSYALFPHLTALENVMEGLAERAAEARRERALELLGKVHLAGLEGRKPAQLSGGQQQRVAVARALARDPRLLLLDEPFSAVDRRTREQLHAELAELRRELNIPVVLVTHDLDEAAMLADRMCILSRGRTLQTGTPADVLQHPASVEVARLVGMTNLFAGRVVAHFPESATTALEWEGRSIKARLQERFPPGTVVAWGIPASGVLLVPLDHSALGPRDNPVQGTVTRLLTLGDRVRASIRLDGEAGPLLAMTAPRHIAARYALSEGVTVAVRLRGESIQLMPHETSVTLPDSG